MSLVPVTPGPSGRLRSVAVVGLAISWLFIVILNYYVVHKPFSLDNLFAILNELGDIAVWLSLAALAGAIGQRVLRGFAFSSPLETGIFAFGIGWGVISFSTFALGLVGVLNRLLFWGILLLALILLRNELRQLMTRVRAIRLPVGSRFESGLLLFITATLGLAFLLALAPTISWDAQIYHLLEVKTVLAQGRITPPPDVVSMNYPSLVEMLYLAAMTLKGDGATSLIHLGFALLTLGALLAFSTRFLSTRVGWYAAAIVCAVPSFILVAAWPYNDAALAFYSFGALYALIVAKENLEWRWFALAGACAGLALGMKYTAAIIPVALLIVMWLDRKKLSLQHWVALLVACGLVASPWYLRNLVFTGNPIYPFFFGGRYWDAFRGYWYGLFGTGLLNNPLHLLIAPWDATIMGQEGRASYEATITPLLLAFLPLLLLFWRRVREDRVVRDGLVFVAVLFAFWMVGLATSLGLIQTRLLFPAFPALALLTAVAIDNLPALDLPQFSLARFGRALIAVVLGLTLCAQLLDFLVTNPIPYLAGFETHDVYLASRLGPGYWEAMQFIGRLPNARVLFLWEPRGYYVSKSVQIQTDEILDVFRDLRYQYHDAATIAQVLREQGYTHILLARWGLDFELDQSYAGLSLDDVQLLQELLTRYARQVSGTEPLDYSVNAEGKISIVGVDREPYAVYQLLPELATGQKP